MLSFERQIITICVDVSMKSTTTISAPRAVVIVGRHCQLHHTLNGLASVVVVMAPPVTFYSFAAVRFSHRQDKLVD